MPRRRGIGLVGCAVIWWVAGALVLGAAAAWAVGCRFRAKVARAVARVRAVSLPEAPDHPQLPPHGRASGWRGAAPRWVRIEQAGAMRLDPSGPWKPFTAEQVYAVGEPAFVWNARFQGLRVVDSLVGGEGMLEARLGGVIPVVRTAGRDVARAQMLRYLAEIAWVPWAASHCRGIRWQPLGGREVRGELDAWGEHVELHFTVDAAGDIVRVRGVRDRMVERAAVPTPWGGEFSDYRTVGGVRIPTRGEVRWELESGPFVYWRGRVTALSHGE